MPSIPNTEKVRRLHAISELINEEKTDHEIATKLGLPITTVKRNILWLEELRKADITPKETAEKRSEIYLGLIDAVAEAKKLFDMYKKPFPCPLCEGTGKTKSDKENKKDPKEAIMDICINCKGLGYIHYTSDADRFHKAWLRTYEQMAKLYGLDTPKSNVAINQQFNLNKVEDKVDFKAGEAIAKAIIESHERKNKK